MYYYIFSPTPTPPTNLRCYLSPQYPFSPVKIRFVSPELDTRTSTKWKKMNGSMSSLLNSVYRYCTRALSETLRYLLPGHMGKGSTLSPKKIPSDFPLVFFVDAFNRFVPTGSVCLLRRVYGFSSRLHQTLDVVSHVGTLIPEVGPTGVPTDCYGFGSLSCRRLCRCGVSGGSSSPTYQTLM